MTQKINPTNNKLGVLQIWNYQFQKYGRSFKGYSKFIQPKNYFLIYLKRVLLQNTLLIKNIDLIYSNSQIIISIFTFTFNRQFVKIEEKILLNTASCWFNRPVKLLVYQSHKLDISSILLTNYISYLLSLKTISTKQLLQLVFNVLLKQFNRTKFTSTIKGFQLIKLKGFKLEFTGCFESSRNQMSKTIKYGFGSTPLTRLNGYIEYSNNSFFTKFGSCGFKLWLFYELL